MGVCAAVFDGIVSVFFYHVMVAVEHIETSAFVETGEQGKDILMGFYDLFHAAVFPQFVSVPKLDIGISKDKVMLQGGKIEILVFHKIVI